MNAFDYSHLLPPLLLGAAGLSFAGLLHRTIVRSSVLLSRRHFFESLAVLAFMVALVLAVSGFALWRSNPLFVLVCSGSWMLICAVAAGALHGRRRYRADDELALPDLWPVSPEHSIDANATLPATREPLSSAQKDTAHGRAVPLDPFTRARLKKARRERSTGDGRLRNNRSVYAKEGSGRRDRPDENR